MTEPNPSESLVLSVETRDAGMRLDTYCAAQVEWLSRSQAQKLNSRGHILVDGFQRADRYALKAGEQVTITRPVVPPETEPQPEDIPICIVYEDDDLLVVNKKAGLVVHPAYGHRHGTLVNAILGAGVRLAALGAPDRPGIVHRLDKDTSGLMVVAKTDAAYQGLAEQIKSRRMHKVYHAIVWGQLGGRTRTISAAIARHPVQRQRMAVARRGGREAITEVFVVDSFEHFDYIRVVLLTGRTHQIRVHLSHISHPILGDPVYGGRRKKNVPSNAEARGRIASLLKHMSRQALHASVLGFVHPSTDECLVFRAALPDDMRVSLETLHGEHSIKEARR